MKNYYELLGVSQDMSCAEIENELIEAAVNFTEEEMEAYVTLVNIEARNAYDTYLEKLQKTMEARIARKNEEISSKIDEEVNKGEADIDEEIANISNKIVEQVEEELELEEIKDGKYKNEKLPEQAKEETEEEMLELEDIFEDTAEEILEQPTVDEVPEELENEEEIIEGEITAEEITDLVIPENTELAVAEITELAISENPELAISENPELAIKEEPKKRKTGRFVIGALAAVVMLGGIAALGSKACSSCGKNTPATATEDTNDNNDETIENNNNEVVEKVITELNIEEFNNLVSEVEKANAEAGLNIRKENLELAIFMNNMHLATPELIKEMESRYNNEEEMINVYLQTMTSYNNDKTEYYNGEDTKYADPSILFADEIDRETVRYIDNAFNEFYVNPSNENATSLVQEVEGYMVKNDTINGYNKDQLTVGGFFFTKLKTDDEMANLAAAGYATGLESNINNLLEANLEAAVARTYSALGSSLSNCEDEKQLVR